MSIIIKSPLSVPISKKKQFILNLNNYRNLFYRLLNISKINYKEIVKQQIQELLPDGLEKIAVIYRVYKGDKRRFDLGNICSVHEKYFEDAVVELGKLPDDKYNNIISVVFLLGGIASENPRVDIEVYDMNDEYDRKCFYRDIKEGK